MAHTAAIIVTYNSEETIPSCLAALAAQAPDTHVIVVDNASSDRSVALARARGVEVIANRKNLGFAAAVNQGFAATDQPCVLVMNPDVELQTPIAALAAACVTHGIAGGRLTESSGRTQQGFTIRAFPTATVLALELLGVNRLWPGNPWNRVYRYLDRDLNVAGPADQPAGAFLMIRRDVWKNLGGFDECFWPIWFEDVDFCRRASDAGYAIHYTPAASACHSGGHSIKKIDDASRQLYWYDSLLRYAEKHFRVGVYRLLCVTSALGALPRIVPGIIRQKSVYPIVNYFRILNLVGRRLVSRPLSGFAQRPVGE